MAPCHVPLPAMLMSVVAVGCVAVALVAFLPMYFMADSNTNAMGEDLIDASTRGSTSDLRSNIERTRMGVDLIDLMLDHTVGTALDVPKLQESFLSLMAMLYPQGVNYIVLATDVGYFYGLERTANGGIYWRTRNESFPCRTEWSLPNGLDLTQPVVEVLTPDSANCAYEPRNRSWYKQLNRDVTDLSKAYVYSSTADVALTFGKRVYYSDGSPWGVVTADVSMLSLTTLLRAGEFGRTGDAFLFEVATGTTLGTSTGEVLLTDYKAGKGDLTPVSTLNTHYARTAFAVAGDALRSPGKVETTVKEDGYWVSIRDLTDTALMHWRLVIVVPVNDYFGDVHRSRNMTVGITVGMVVVVILLACLMLPLILIPLGILRSKVQRAATLDTDIESSVGTSIITEIDHLQERVGQLSNAMVSFTRYIPKEVVRDMLAAGRGVAEIGMEPAHLCVLFSDIVKFTAICESVTPEDLSSLLNAYFSRCVTILVRHNATVDKFIGDAIMAFWGAPMPNENAEVWACLASIHMQAEVRREVQPIFERCGHNLGVRIGVHSGTALVGNIGSNDRLSYTALGDTVNVAARLEGCNKVFNSSIMISSVTREFISDKNFLIRYLGKIQVVGREAPLPIYEVHAVLSDTINVADIDNHDHIPIAILSDVDGGDSSTFSQVNSDGEPRKSPRSPRGGCANGARNRRASHTGTQRSSVQYHVDSSVVAAARKRKGAFNNIDDAFAEVKKRQTQLSRHERLAITSFHQGMMNYQRGSTFLSEALLNFNTCKTHLLAVPKNTDPFEEMLGSVSNPHEIMAISGVRGPEEQTNRASNSFPATAPAIAEDTAKVVDGSKGSEEGEAAVIDQMDGGAEMTPFAPPSAATTAVPVVNSNITTSTSVIAGLNIASPNTRTHRLRSEVVVVGETYISSPHLGRSVRAKSHTHANEAYGVNTSVVSMKVLEQMIERCTQGMWSESVLQTEK